MWNLHTQIFWLLIYFRLLDNVIQYYVPIELDNCCVLLSNKKQDIYYYLKKNCFIFLVLIIYLIIIFPTSSMIKTVQANATKKTLGLLYFNLLFNSWLTHRVFNHFPFVFFTKCLDIKKIIVKKILWYMYV